MLKHAAVMETGRAADQGRTLETRLIDDACMLHHSYSAQHPSSFLAEQQQLLAPLLTYPIMALLLCHVCVDVYAVPAHVRLTTKVKTLAMP